MPQLPDGTRTMTSAIKILQRHVDAAWRSGFDPETARIRGGRIEGRTGYDGELGGPEALVLMWHLRVDAFIVEVVDRVNAGAAVFQVATACFSSEQSDASRGDASHASGRKRPIDELSGGGGRGGGCGSCSRRPPLLLQHEGHSRSIIGVLRSPAPRILLRDPSDPLRLVRCVAPATLDGRQYQIVVAGQAAPLPPSSGDSTPSPASTGVAMLTDERALARRGEPNAAAMWSGGRWLYDGFCRLRFNARIASQPRETASSSGPPCG